MVNFYYVELEQELDDNRWNWEKNWIGIELKELEQELELIWPQRTQPWSQQWPPWTGLAVHTHA